MRQLSELKGWACTGPIGENRMFIQFKKLNNESGVVLFIVLMSAIIIMMFSVGILTQSMNEINYAQKQMDQIASDQLSKGIFWNAYASQMGGPATMTMNTTQSGRSFDVSMGPSAGNNPANVFQSYTVTTSYYNPGSQVQTDD
jgi:hypothetical protein